MSLFSEIKATATHTHTSTHVCQTDLQHPLCSCVSWTEELKVDLEKDFELPDYDSYYHLVKIIIEAFVIINN